MKDCFVILAAGEGKRMKSKYSKVSQKIMGKPMIKYIVDEIKSNFENAQIIVVVGHKKEDVIKILDGYNVDFVEQEKQLGTAHACMMAVDKVNPDCDYIYILYGDTPFIKSTTLNRMKTKMLETDASLCMLTALFDNPYGYGRIIVDSNQKVVKIVEEKDADDEIRKIKEINPGFYLFKKASLISALQRIDNNNAQREYYLTDAIEKINNMDGSVVRISVEDNFEVMGINSRYEIYIAEKELRCRINKKHLERGVMIIDIENTYISPDAVIGQDTIIYPQSYILGKSIIGEDCVIGPQSYIIDSKIGNSCKILFSMIEESEIKDNVKIGPYSHLRPHSILEEGVKIGNFVEIKNSRMGKNSKSAHLTYVGDADVGSDVNLGCGTIFVNYDGYKKHKTVVEDGAFIGCNTNLVAPVKVGKNAFVAAGSTITRDVPENALAIARERQVNKENWVLKRKR